MHTGTFLLSDVLDGNSYLWHELYSLLYTSILGFVACCVTLKGLGIGSAERSWADVKKIKDKNQSNLGRSCFEKKAILFISAISEKQISPKVQQFLTIPIFGDKDMK